MVSPSAVQDNRVFTGSDIELDHRLMVCKLQLHLRKPAIHTFHPGLQPAPLHSEAGKEALQLSLQGLPATHHQIHAVVKLRSPWHRLS